jgi:uncharacterized protein (TIGR03083 family)
VVIVDAAALDQYLEWIVGESAAFTAVLRADTLERAVPACPAWRVRDLAWHLGRVQDFWADDVVRPADAEPDFSGERTPGPDDAIALVAWLEARTAKLVANLRATPAATEVWTWWRDDRTAGAVARHQVQEAAVHRWDAQSACGAPAPLEPALADDGVDEFLWIVRQLRGETPVAFRTTDTNREVSAAAGSGAAATVEGTASDLVLLLYGRIPLDTVAVAGDRALVEALLVPIE